MRDQSIKVLPIWIPAQLFLFLGMNERAPGFHHQSFMCVLGLSFKRKEKKRLLKSSNNMFVLDSFYFLEENLFLKHHEDGPYSCNYTYITRLCKAKHNPRL